MTSASQQLEAMQQAIEAIEGELVECAHDGTAYAQAIARRGAMLREIERLAFAAEREKRQDAEAHRAALHERFADAVATAATVRDEGAVIDAQIMATIRELDGMLKRAAELTRQHRNCASQSQNSLSAMRQLGMKLPPGGVGEWRVPAESTTLEFYATALRMLAAVSLTETSVAVISARQRVNARR